MQDHQVKYEAVIGLEVHVQLNTESKLFSSDANRFGSEANQHISVISLGHPGSLPRLNREVIRHAIRLGLATRSRIASSVTFARKNYFYTDLPKGYQISQHESPICSGGHVPVRIPGSGIRNIRLIRIHIEEDAGKSLHDRVPEATLIDLNRAGVPLLEIVTEPDLRNGQEAYFYLGEIRRMVRFLGISDGNMEEGSLRCDANVSVRYKGDQKLGTRTEIKNLNSITHVRRAIEYEIDRQIKTMEKGTEVIQQTMGYDERNDRTFPIRGKEEADDYRYFPEPDLNPVMITSGLLEEMEASQPSLPQEIFERLTRQYHLPEQDADILSDSPEFSKYFLNLADHIPDPKMASNWMIGPVRAWLNETHCSIEDFPLSYRRLAGLICLVHTGRVSYSSAQQKLFVQLLENPHREPEQLAKDLDLILESTEETIMKQVETALDSYPDKIREYHKGKKGLLGFFMGEVMKISKGKADPQKANRLLRIELENRK